MSEKNYVRTAIEEGVRRAVEETKNYPKHGLVCLVFPELPQYVVDQMHEEIEQILEDKLNTLVMVDI